MIQGIEDGMFARIGPATSSSSKIRYSVATRTNDAFTFKKSGGGPGSSGAVSIDEQAVKPRQITSHRVECTFLKPARANMPAFFSCRRAPSKYIRKMARWLKIALIISGIFAAWVTVSVLTFDDNIKVDYGQ
jgi:hypothetical protein